MVADTQRRLEDQPRSRLEDSACGFGRPGVHPVYSVQSVCGLAQVLDLRCLSLQGGGDEETRTPDLLLAKEMLYQLSYVPLASRELWWAFLDSNQRPLPYQGSALTS
jgi:hypothetical protein